MSIRAAYIISTKEDADIPLFSKYFHSVETRCKSRSGQLYVKIPPEREFVKLVLTETGVNKGDNFIEVRDHCEKEFSNPALQLKTDLGILWPVLVMESGSLLYCAITFEENFKNYHQSSGMKLAQMASITRCLEALNGLAQCVEVYSLLQGKSNTTELHKYINSAFPFGRPICCTPSIAISFPSSSWKGKVKQPAWNPLQHKGKSYVTFCIKEEIKCIQLNQNDRVQAHGVIVCNSEVEGVAPEISLVLTNPLETKCGLLVNASVSSVEYISCSSTRLRFHPVKSQNVCFYKVSGVLHPPIQGVFSLKIKDDIASIFVQLKLQKGVKNSFQRLDVHIPLTCIVSTVKSHCSQGSLVVGSSNTLVWNVGVKLPSKTLEATLRARAKLKQNKSGKPSERLTIEHLPCDIEKQCLASGPLSNIENSKYAHVFFTIMDYTYSGYKIDAQSVVVSTGSKVNRSVSYECFSETYKIWNNETNDDIMEDSLVEELTTILENT